MCRTFSENRCCLNCAAIVLIGQVEKQRRLERIQHKTQQLQELILQVRVNGSSHVMNNHSEMSF